jgi:hypothetical protein
MRNLENYLSCTRFLVDPEVIMKLEFPLGEKHEVVKHLRLTTAMNSYEAEEYLMTMQDLFTRLSTASVRGTEAGKKLKKILEEVSNA